MPMKHFLPITAALACLLLADVRADVSKAAGQIIRTSGASGGICAIVGATDTDLALAIAKQGRFVVHCLAPDAKTCDALRKTIRASGPYGTVSADVLNGSQLPYADNLLNIIVTGDDCRVAKAELLRALAPNGVACSASPQSAFHTTA